MVNLKVQVNEQCLVPHAESSLSLSLHTRVDISIRWNYTSE